MTIDQVYIDLVEIMRKLHALSFDTSDRLLVTKMLRVVRRFIRQIDDAKAVAIFASR